MQVQWNASDKELANIKAIAESDRPVLMININKYNDAEYPSEDIYKEYMKILPKLLKEVAAKVLWRLTKLGQPVGSQSAHEMLSIWYPSHKSFLALRDQPSSIKKLPSKEFMSFGSGRS
jgi:hypothetical protein